jgi:hypothetical protein
MPDLNAEQGPACQSKGEDGQAYPKPTDVPFRKGRRLRHPCARSVDRVELTVSNLRRPDGSIPLAPLVPTERIPIPPRHPAVTSRHVSRPFAQHSCANPSAGQAEPRVPRRGRPGACSRRDGARRVLDGRRRRRVRRSGQASTEPAVGGVFVVGLDVGVVVVVGEVGVYEGDSIGEPVAVGGRR